MADRRTRWWGAGVLLSAAVALGTSQISSSSDNDATKPGVSVTTPTSEFSPSPTTVPEEQRVSPEKQKEIDALLAVFVEGGVSYNPSQLRATLSRPGGLAYGYNDGSTSFRIEEGTEGQPHTYIEISFSTEDTPANRAVEWQRKDTLFRIPPLPQEFGWFQDSSDVYERRGFDPQVGFSYTQDYVFGRAGGGQIFHTLLVTLRGVEVPLPPQPVGRS